MVISIEDSRIKKMVVLLNLDKFAKKQFLIKRLGLTKNCLACLCGTGCSGKSMFLEYLAVCISSGVKIFNVFDITKGKVIYIDQEQSENQTLLRIRRICNGLNVENVEIERIVLNSRLDSKDVDQKALEDLLVQDFNGAVLVVIDSLKATTEVDENSSDIEKTLKMLKRVSEKANCCILVCHHKGKGKDVKQSGRGHSSIYDSFDVQIDIENEQDKYTLKCAKMRDGKFFNGIQFSILDKGYFVEDQNCTSELVFELTDDKVKPAAVSQKEKILCNLMSLNKPINNKDLYSLVKGDKSSFVKTIQELLDKNLIEEQKGIKNSKLLKITEKGITAFYFYNESSS